MQRRDFLRRAGSATAAVAATAAVGSSAGCGGSGSGSGGSGSGVAESTSTAPPNWRALSGMLTGSLVVPGDASYAADAQDPLLHNWAEAYYWSNLTRLMSVKRHHDPDDVFHFAQSIPLSATP
ncbi:MAG TPA: BBE domain-containing protein [Acidimicrobiales bacterium]|nr:BBE domain-containing protein [Acidimicrobiales bacterium]